MTLSRLLHTILALIVLASLSFHLIFHATHLTASRWTTTADASWRRHRHDDGFTDPLEEELAVQLLYHTCHRIDDHADCRGRCHWCGSVGGVYDDETDAVTGRRYPCVPTRNPCHRHVPNYNKNNNDNRPQRRVVVPAEDLPPLKPDEIQALRQLQISNQPPSPPTRKVAFAQSNVKDDVPKRDNSAVITARDDEEMKKDDRTLKESREITKPKRTRNDNVMHRPKRKATNPGDGMRNSIQPDMRQDDPRQSARKPRIKAPRDDASFHHFPDNDVNTTDRPHKQQQQRSERRNNISPRDDTIVVPKLDRAENRARNAARQRAREDEYDAMTTRERDRLLVTPREDFYRFRYFAPIVSEEFKLVYVPIPKVACTQWLQLFRRVAGRDDWHARVGGLPYTPGINGLTYLSDYNLTEATHILSSPEWTRFVFVRDPKERFLSAYLDKVVNSQMVVFGSCCRTTRDCVTNRTTLTEFFHLTRTCHNEHWDVQSQRVPAKIWKTIDFVGHMDTLERDARRLLERVGAWDAYGASGWGQDGQQAVFAEATAGSAQNHATRAQQRMRQYYTPELEMDTEERYREDYENPLFRLPRRRLFPETERITTKNTTAAAKTRKALPKTTKHMKSPLVDKTKKKKRT